MKLPEYDNRPSPGEPLYSSDSGGGNIKWPAAIIGIVALLGFGIYMLVTGLADLFS